MRRRGFTLIEMLVAVSLGAVLLAITAQVFATAIAGRERLRGTSTDLAALRRAYETISRDMHCAVVAPDDSGLQFGLTVSPAGAGADVLQLAAVVGEPLLAGRAVNETSLVQYAIAPDPRSGRPTLWRYETSYPVPEGGSAGQLDDTRSVPLLAGVIGASYQFYSEAQQTWIESWEGETGLPMAIRIDLALEAQGGGEQPGSLESWMFTLPAARHANAVAETAAQEAAQ